MTPSTHRNTVVSFDKARASSACYAAGAKRGSIDAARLDKVRRCAEADMPTYAADWRRVNGYYGVDW